VINSGGVTFLEVLYIIKDVYGWIRFAKDIWRIFLHVKKLADSCLVLYQSARATLYSGEGLLLKLARLEGRLVVLAAAWACGGLVEEYIAGEVEE
jgi:hypothetical protein